MLQLKEKLEKPLGELGWSLEWKSGINVIIIFIFYVSLFLAFCHVNRAYALLTFLTFYHFVLFQILRDDYCGKPPHISKDFFKSFLFVSQGGWVKNQITPRDLSFLVSFFILFYIYFYRFLYDWLYVCMYLLVLTLDPLPKMPSKGPRRGWVGDLRGVVWIVCENVWDSYNFMGVFCSGLLGISIE